MMTRLHLLGAAFFALVMSPMGCATHDWSISSSPDQSWCGKESRIHETNWISFPYFCLVPNEMGVRWKCLGGKTYDAVGLSRVSAAFMKDRIDLRPEIKENEVSDIFYIYSSWRSIVSVSPLVVISVPVKYATPADIFRDSEGVVEGKPFYSIRGESRRVQLPYGFVGLTRVPYASPVIWCAPSLNLGPKELQISPGGKAKFSVGDTDFELVDDNGEIVIRRLN